MYVSRRLGQLPTWPVPDVLNPRSEHRSTTPTDSGAAGRSGYLPMGETGPPKLVLSDGASGEIIKSQKEFEILRPR